MRINSRTYKKYFIVVLLLCFSCPAWALPVLKGKIWDQQTKAPITNALIIAYKADSTAAIAGSAIADSMGCFQLALDPGSYNVAIQLWEQVLWSSTLELLTDTDLGSINVNTGNINELEVFTLKQKKPVLKIEQGKLVYTPPMESAGTVYDIMKTVPGVQATDESIQITGKGAAGIMINGRWQRMAVAQLTDYLKSIPAARIEKIELVRNPYAEMDAEKKSGYINIVLKGQTEQGLSGSAFINPKQGMRFSLGTGVQVNGNTGKWQYALTASLYHNNRLVKGSNVLHYPALYWIDSSRQSSGSTPVLLSLSGDYAINKKHIVGGGFYFNRTATKNTETNPTFIYNTDRTRLDSTLLTTAINPEKDLTWSLNANYIFHIDSNGRKLRFDFDHFAQHYDRLQDFSNFRSDSSGLNMLPAKRYESGNSQEMRITTANLAVDIPVSWADIAFGAKITAISNINRTSFYENIAGILFADSSRFDHFKYYENTQALYAKISKKLNKWSFMLGVRGENTGTKGRSEVYNVESRKSYFKLFPSADISCQVNADNLFSLSYARRIDRPMFAQVNPFRWYHTQYAFTHGNPALQPYFSHNVEMNYLLRSQWNFNLGYCRSDRVFAEVDLVDPVLHTRETIVDNILNENSYFLGVSSSFHIRKRWLVYPQAGISYNQVQSKVSYLQYSAGLFAYASLYQQIAVDKNRKLLIDLNTYYYSPRNYGVMQFKTIWAQSAGLTCSVLKQQLQISLSLNDIFKTSAMRYNSIVNETLRERYVYRDQRYISLMLRYNFKYGQVKEQREAGKANQDEMQRAGK